MERKIGQLPHWVEKAVTAEDVQEEDRSIRFVASDETVDRYGDIVSADGWQLGDFKRNPIFLWMHDYTAPIGRVVKVGVEDQKLMATVKFASAGVSALADSLWSLVKERILRAVSVGFMVEREKDYEPIRDVDGMQTGTHFLRQQLLELSLVSVPANPAALSVARSLALPHLVRQALPLDASVIRQQAEFRQRVQVARLGAHRFAPR